MHAAEDRFGGILNTDLEAFSTFLDPGGAGYLMYICDPLNIWETTGVEFYLYPTVGTVLIHSVKPELTE